MTKKINLIGIVGPTATGKTGLAVHLAQRLDTEIISADSRQIYRGMDLGTGKDLEEYTINGQKVPYHLIDIHDAGYEYNIFEYQKDFYRIFKELLTKKKVPLLCGGSGLYIDSVVKGYELLNVPPNPDLRVTLEEKTDEELKDLLLTYRDAHNNTDFFYRKRLLRAIEIADYCQQNQVDTTRFPKVYPLLFGIKFEAAYLRKRITIRLKERFQEGMIEEVQKLLDQGVPAEKLEYYGLEYKYIVQYILGKQGKFNDMKQRLNSAIHQFAKRQRTWYRRMEKQGSKIIWIDGQLPLEDKLFEIDKHLKGYKISYEW